MKRIKNESGDIVNGAFRTDVGAISMYDPVGYGKYLKEKERATEIVRLNQKVETLETMVNRMLAALEEKTK